MRERIFIGHLLVGDLENPADQDEVRSLTSSLWRTSNGARNNGA